MRPPALPLAMQLCVHESACRLANHGMASPETAITNATTPRSMKPICFQPQRFRGRFSVRELAFIFRGANSGAQRQLTPTTACGSAQAAGSTVRRSDKLAVIPWAVE